VIINRNCQLRRPALTVCNTNMDPNKHSEIEEKIKQLLVSELNVNPAIVQDTDSNTPLLGRGIGLDSVEAMALVVTIEEEFGVFIPDDQLTVDLFKSVSTLTAYIVNALSHRE
jgi:acyl carrier protein